MNLWKDLAKPFLVMAPLEGVADTVFRRIVASCAKPDVFFTEFTSADGFCSPGKSAVEENFLFTPEEEPIIAQIWGNNPDTLYRTAKAISGRGFSGIDINMGCPDRTVMAHGGGSAMIDTPELAAGAIQAIKCGIQDSGYDIAISVKTRLGNRTQITESWARFLLEQDIDALTIHARTARELSKVPARWDEVGKVVRLRKSMNVRTVVIGNGDVKDAADARKKYDETGADGIMIGRGIFENMWAFDTSAPPHIQTPAELLDVMERHVRLFADVWGDRKNFLILRKFFKIYIKGFPNAVEYRIRAMEAESSEQIYALIDELRTAWGILNV